MLDFALTYAHHLAVFAIVSILAVELLLVRPGLDRRMLPTLGRIDMAYGAVAGLVIVVGVLRLLSGAAGWGFYVTNLFFWLKMLAFLVVGLLSIPPTLTFVGWRRAADADPAYAPPAAEIASARRFVVRRRPGPRAVAGPCRRHDTALAAPQPTVLGSNRHHSAMMHR